MRAERSTSIDVLKGIGIISVVIGHAMNTDNYYSGSVELIRKFVYLYHLAVFFFCSGYLLKASQRILSSNLVCRKLSTSVSVWCTTL